MSEWKEYRLEELCTKITDGSHQSPKAFDGGKPMFSVKDMTEHGFIENSCKRISHDDFYKLVAQGCKPEVDDVVIAKDGSVMKHVFKIENELDGVLLSSIAILRPDKTLVDPDFLVFSLLSPAVKNNVINNYVSGSGVPRIVLKDFKKVLLKIPSLEMQKEIASIFVSKTKKVHLNQQINRTLEEMAQTIFKSWFVDFEPVKSKIKAKQAGGNAEQIQIAAMCAISGKTEQQLKELPQETLTQLKTTANLFPEAMQESEFGQIPESWRLSDLDEVTELIIDHRGKTPKKLGGDWAESGYAAISAKNVKSGRLINPDNIRYVDDDIYQKWMKEELSTGDVLLTSEGPMGELYFLTDETKYCLSQRLYALRANHQSISPSFLYLWLQSHNAKADMESRATGTTVVGIRQSELRKVCVLVPTQQLVMEFEKIAFPLFEKIAHQEKVNNSLSAIRDALLPKLLKGEI